MAQRISGPAAAGGVTAAADRRPPRAGLVLATLILGAALQVSPARGRRERSGLQRSGNIPISTRSFT